MIVAACGLGAAKRCGASTQGQSGGGGGFTPYANQPAGWTVIDDQPWAVLNRTGWTNAAVNSTASIVTDADFGTAGDSDSTALNQLYRNGVDSSATSEAVQFYGLGFTYRRLYVARWWKFDPQFYGQTQSSTNKLEQFMLQHADGTELIPSNRCYTNLSANGTGTAHLQPALQGCSSNGNLTTDGVTVGAAVSDQTDGHLASSQITRGQVYHVETIVTCNTATGANGSVEMWINGVKTHWFINVNFASGANLVVGEFKLDNVWGGNVGTIPYDFYLRTGRSRLVGSAT